MATQPELLVVADDITGSLDTGVQFATSAREAVVTLWPARLPEGGAAVWVVDTESRHVAPRAAAARVSEAVGDARRRGVRLFYKKTDSTLRGNLGAELEAALAASGRKRLAFAPAFPALGRTTRAGMQLVRGVPVSETPFARDPLDPVATSDVARLIAAQTRLSVARAADAKSLRDEGAGEARIVVVDAECDEDLAALAEVLWPEREGWLFAGSAGFANALRMRMEADRAPVAASRSPARGEANGESLGATLACGPEARVLIVSGSLNPVSLEQAERAEAAGIPSIVAPLEEPGAPLEEGAALEGAGAPSLEAARALSFAARALDEKGVLLVRSISPSGAARRTAGSEIAARRSSGAGGGQEIEASRRLASFVRPVAERNRPEVLVVFGGDTLVGIMRALEIEGLSPRGEVTAGVPVSVPVPPVPGGAPRLVISKAGGFGDPDVVSTILARLSFERGRKKRE